MADLEQDHKSNDRAEKTAVNDGSDSFASAVRETYSQEGNDLLKNINSSKYNNSGSILGEFELTDDAHNKNKRTDDQTWWGDTNEQSPPTEGWTKSSDKKCYEGQKTGPHQYDEESEKEPDWDPEKESEKDPEPDPKTVKLAEENGLQVDAKVVDGKTVNEYYVPGPDGEHQVVLETDQPPEKAKEQIDQWAKDKTRDLEKTFNVQISGEGETDVYGRGLPWSSYATRAPNAGELATLEQALLRSVPDTQTFSGKPLKISYLKDHVPDEGVGAFARGEEIVLSPHPTQSTIIHELAHIGQQELAHDWVPRGLESETGRDNIRKEFADKMGWKASDNGWILEDKDGNYWKPVKWPGEDWVRTDDNGNPADANGKRTDNPLNPFDHGEDTAQHKSSAEIAEIAKVTPTSSYFPNPAEMWAEMAANFRNGEQSRQDLFEQDPDTYRLTRDLDQQQINSEFGIREDGQPNKIRLPNGLVVDNTDENRTAVDSFEKSIGA